MALNAMLFFVCSTAQAAAVTKDEQDKFDKGKYILLQVKIPSPTCATVPDNASFTGDEASLCCQHKVIKDIIADKNATISSKTQISCPFGSVAAVKNAPAFLVSFVQFIIIFLAIAVTGILVVSGILYITSGGNPAKASKALDYMRNAAYSLVVLIFSAVILNQIGPRFTSIGISSVTDIVARFLCTELDNQTDCEAKGTSCYWNANANLCQNTSEVRCYDLNESKCKELASKCSWDSSLNTCLDIRASNLTCSPFNFESCFTAAGCAWQDTPVCLGTTPDSDATCNALVKMDDCIKPENHCKWQSPGGCILEKTALSRNCGDYDFLNCPSASCYKDVAQRTCVQAYHAGQTCIDTHQGYPICGSLGYCNSDTKKCGSRIPGGFKCSTDSQCLSGDCGGLLDSATGKADYGTCTNPGT